LYTKEKMPMEDEDCEGEEIKKIDNFSEYRGLQESFKSERSKNNETTNSFAKIKKDFHEKKSKILKKDQKQMMVMHDC